mmetsp:Transcript_1456/g.2552  ORF Transcript_1456/g.2552 Transcript_1456/m.2552 type:complete len:243 (-) Transcript_1456:936-1664(-)
MRRVMGRRGVRQRWSPRRGTRKTRKQRGFASVWRDLWPPWMTRIRTRTRMLVLSLRLRTLASPYQPRCHGLANLTSSRTTGIQWVLPCGMDFLMSLIWKIGPTKRSGCTSGMLMMMRRKRRRERRGRRRGMKRPAPTAVPLIRAPMKMLRTSRSNCIGTTTKLAYWLAFTMMILGATLRRREISLRRISSENQTARRWRNTRPKGPMSVSRFRRRCLRPPRRKSCSSRLESWRRRPWPRNPG